MALSGVLFGVGMKSLIKVGLKASIGTSEIPGLDEVVDYYSDKTVNSDFIRYHENKNNMKSVINKYCKNAHIDEEIKLYMIEELFIFLGTQKVAISDFSDKDKLAQTLFKEYKATHSDNSEEELNCARTILDLWAENLINAKAEDVKELLKSLAIEFENVYNQINGIEEDSRKRWTHQNYINKDNDERISRIEEHYETINVPDKTEIYREKWIKNVFLNDYDEHDEIKGVNIQFKDLYIMPSYKWGNSAKNYEDLSKLLANKLNKPLLILGQPGGGKSSLITYILNEETGGYYETIIVYKFSDLNMSRWDSKSEDNGKYILREIGKVKGDFNAKTLIIIDGFDEISIDIDRVSFLDDLAELWHGISFIITCRENYLYNLNRLKNMNYLTLNTWEGGRIKEFISKYQKLSNKLIDDNIIQKAIRYKEVLGIPLILYMALALDIQIDGVKSDVDIYCEIFKLNGGIYDRMKYDLKHKIISDEDTKIKIHNMSSNLALWMYKYNPEKAEVPREAYEQIDGFTEGLLYGSYFKAVPYQEGYGTESICFVHRTIYEYFVAEQICEKLLEYNAFDSKIMDREHIENELALFLEKGIITEKINSYIYRLLEKKCNVIECRKKLLDEYEKIASNIVENGFMYYLKKVPPHYCNLERQCGINLLLLLKTITFVICQDKEYVNIIPDSLVSHILRFNEGNNIDFSYCELNRDAIRENMSFLKFDSSKISIHAIACNMDNLKCNNSKICDSNFVGCSFDEANFRHSKIMDTSFEGSYLRGNKTLVDVELINVDFNNMNLSNFYFSGTKMRNVKFFHVNLRNVDFSHAQITSQSISTCSNECNIDGAKFTADQIRKLKRKFFEKMIFSRIYVQLKEYKKRDLFMQFFGGK